MAADKASFTVTEIKAGAMVLVSLLVLVAFLATIRGCGAGRSEINTFNVDFTTISGLNLGAEVRFGGVKAGKVVEIGTHPEDRSRIRVLFEIPADIPVNHGSVATIEQVSLTTGKHLEISTGSVEQPLHQSGDRINSMTLAGGLFDLPDFEGVVGRLETMLDGLIVLLGVERAQLETGSTGTGVVDLAAVTAALEEALAAGTSTLRSVDATIEDNREDLALVVDRLVVLEEAATELLTNLDAAVQENRQPMNATMVNLEKLSEEATRRLEELASSLAVTLRYLESVGGNAGQLAEDHGPTLEQTLVNLEAATRNLRLFSETIAEQPAALVRGAQPTGRQDGGK